MARSTRGATRRRWIFWAGLGVIAAGVWVIAPHEPGTQGRGVRRALWIPFFGVPDGGLGRAGIRLLAKRHAAFAAMAKELDLQPDDDLLDIGCGPGGLLAEQAAHVRFVAGLDLSDLSLGKARQALADRITAGTAEVVQGDAMELPWADGRFSVVSSMNCLKFVPEPARAVREMFRVLRPGGRAFITSDHKAHPHQDESGKVDAWGQWWWSDADAQRLMESAGFVDVTLAVLPLTTKEHVFRGIKPERGATGL